jgi:aldehyde:ferredoxin oxidoreductase
VYGYNGRIAQVNLQERSLKIENPDEFVYRMYLGGRGLGAYYLFRELEPKTDALGPNNKVIVATSVITGIPIAGMARCSIVSKSPLTGTYGETEAGGYFGEGLKTAGFDALIIEGCSTTPVYLFVHDEQVEFRDASRIWGKNTREAQAEIREQLGDRHARVALIGLAGENLVRYACVMNELKFAHGRGGLGAVMGSKRVKAIAVHGNRKPQFKDPEAIQNIAKWMATHWKESPGAVLRSTLGTADALMPLNALGILPTRNFQGGSFANALDLSGQKMAETILTRTDGCYACQIRCKREVAAKQPYETEPEYGGPEYETLAAFGPLCDVGDLGAVSKANELCNAYGLDTISTGSSIAFAIECYQNGLLTAEDTGGLELRWGDPDAVLKLIELIGNRQGIGDLLAEGVKIASERIGKGSERFALHTKGKELAMHDPRGKTGVAIGYAISPSGADHMQAGHDPVFAKPSKFMEMAGITKSVDVRDLGPDKVRAFVYAHLWWGLLDCLGACKFVFIPHNAGVLSPQQLVEMVNASTGWETSLWSLMKASERALTLTRSFNVREGFTAADDSLPERLYEGIEFGPSTGARIDREQFKTALRLYYQMMGWNSETGVPSVAKLLELDLGWINENESNPRSPAE